jgi:hypothetical protein
MRIHYGYPDPHQHPDKGMAKRRGEASNNEECEDEIAHLSIEWRVHISLRRMIAGFRRGGPNRPIHARRRWPTGDPKQARGLVAGFPVVQDDPPQDHSEANKRAEKIET